jgi:hypothetical protein
MKQHKFLSFDSARVILTGSGAVRALPNARLDNSVIEPFHRYRLVRPHLVIKRFDCFLPVLAGVLDCACKDKPSWQGHSCVMCDNQWSNGVVIMRSYLHEALDHQRRDLHPIKLSYLIEDWALPSIKWYQDLGCP